MEDWTFPADPDYLDRPGLSPVVAALRAADVIRSRDRVLEVGCGTGLDAVGLALSGVRRVVGVDKRDRALRIAEERARRAGVAERVSFARASAYDLASRLPRASFDVVVDTLLGSNLDRQDRYAASVAAMLPAGGRLVATYKMARGSTSDPDFAPEGAFGRRFEIKRQVATHLPTRTRTQRRSFLDVVVVVARRRP